MRVISLNLNGIRSAGRKGFFQWLSRQRADIVCLQELKAQRDQILDKLYWPRSFQCYYHPAQKKGYSGVGIYCRKEPDEVLEGIGWDWFDAEGRWIEARFGKLSVVSLYLPSGSSGELRQQVKFKVLDSLLPYLKELKAQGRELLVCGDWNIAHKKEDLKNWRGNQKNSGFLPEERAWMDELFGPAGFVDAFRAVDPREEQYTWWSNRGQAWAKNVGWRIDYQVVTPALAEAARSARIYKDKRFSDHAPLIMDYDLEL
jgi:exodeoxyribonuclease III